MNKSMNKVLDQLYNLSNQASSLIIYFYPTALLFAQEVYFRSVAEFI